MSFFTNAAAIIFKQPFTQKIGKLEIDIVSSRNISESISVSNNPIEEGFNTDDARDMPTEIVVTAIISKFSLKNSKIKQLTTLASGNIPNRLKEAHDELYRIKNEKSPIKLITKYKEYPNMIMTNLYINENANDGETFRFTVTFKEVNIVISKLTAIERSYVKTDNAKNQNSYGFQTSDITPLPKPPGKITAWEFFKNIF